MIIRRAKASEFEDIKSFYNTHWGSIHALVNVKRLFDFFFVDGEFLNFIIARKTEESEIISACGYIPANSTATPDVWTTLWLTQKRAHQNVGLQIVDYIVEKMGFRLVSTNNARLNTLVLYRFLGYETAKMNHYYRLSKRKDYKVAVLNGHHEILPVDKTQYSLKRFETPDDFIGSFDPLASMNNRPYKDVGYIAKRFYDFPFYHYFVYGIFNEEKQCQTIIVFRKAYVRETSILRIVDVVGEYSELANIGHCIQDLLQEHHCEYVDFYCYGIDQEVLRRAGFLQRDPDDKNIIIPNYLEPYAPINTDYHFFCNKLEGFVQCKADGDQDRLNIELL